MDSIQQFSLFRECDEVESWIRERVSYNIHYTIGGAGRVFKVGRP